MNRNLSDCLKKMSSDIQKWPEWKKRIFGDAFPKPMEKLKMNEGKFKHNTRKKRHQISVTDEAWNWLKVLGKSNASEGIEVAYKQQSGQEGKHA